MYSDGMFKIKVGFLLMNNALTQRSRKRKFATTELYTIRYENYRYYLTLWLKLKDTHFLKLPNELIERKGDDLTAVNVSQMRQGVITAVLELSLLTAALITGVFSAVFFTLFTFFHPLLLNEVRVLKMLQYYEDLWSNSLAYS